LAFYDLLCCRAVKPSQTNKPKLSQTKKPNHFIYTKTDKSYILKSSGIVEIIIQGR